MNVLIACEESQTVCKAFRELGHRAFSCDLQESSGGHPEWHINGDCLPLINGNCEFVTEDGARHKQEGKWDLLIAHPPCTYMSKAGARWMYLKAGELNEERLKLAMEAKEFFMKFINADCEYIAVENPIPLKVVELPPPDCVVQPYEFGEPFSKKTCLWLKNLPPLMPTKIRADYVPYLPSNTGGRNEDKNIHEGLRRTQKSRRRHLRV